MGPLSGVKIIELAGIGPGPFCGMMLSDMGADVIRVDRPGGVDGTRDVLCRGRRSIAVNLKSPEGVEVVLKLCEKSDALFEGFRPGVTERLGVGPDECLARNPGLVYGRMTGWGQNGPMAHAAGHDINYISLSGVLHSIGRRDERPVPPLNLVGDFGGGGMMLAFGIVCALLESQKSGKGQVIDTAMVDGSAALMGMFETLQGAGLFSDKRCSHKLDGGAHFYDVYETKDGKYISIGSIEPQFYALLKEKLGLDSEKYEPQFDTSKWPEWEKDLISIFKTRTRNEWCEIMEGTDVCFAPVLSLKEAPEHPHNKARKTFLDINGLVQHAPVPRFSRTVPDKPKAGRKPGQDTDSVLRDLGICEEEIALLKVRGAVSSDNE